MKTNLIILRNMIYLEDQGQLTDKLLELIEFKTVTEYKVNTQTYNNNNWEILWGENAIHSGNFQKVT